MKFSLVMATADRTNEVENFLQHLSRQTCKDFELIIVDQNLDELLQKVIYPYLNMFPLKHIKTDKRGAARARNLGLQQAQGEIIGFPDDDCWYDPDLLHQIAEFFKECPEWDGFGGRAADQTGRTVALKFDRRSGAINRYNAWRRGLTFTVFLRHSSIADFPGFDEQLGVGAGTLWGSGEETDYLIRLTDAGLKILYDPRLKLYHPDPLQADQAKLLERGVSYGRGMGKVMRQNNFPVWFWLYYLLRSLGGGALALLRNNRPLARYYLESFKGRLYGWREGKELT